MASEIVSTTLILENNFTHCFNKKSIKNGFEQSFTKGMFEKSFKRSFNNINFEIILQTRLQQHQC